MAKGTCACADIAGSHGKHEASLAFQNDPTYAWLLDEDLPQSKIPQLSTQHSLLDELDLPASNSPSLRQPSLSIEAGVCVCGAVFSHDLTACAACLDTEVTNYVIHLYTVAHWQQGQTPDDVCAVVESTVTSLERDAAKRLATDESSKHQVRQGVVDENLDNWLECFLADE